MSEYYSTIFNRNGLRIVFAAMFLFVLLAEFGSHVMAHASAPHGLEQLVSALDADNDGPCKHIVPCCDNSHSNQQMPNTGHQLVPNDLIEITQFVPEVDVNINPPIPFESSNALFRESSPPFHPPRLS